jgi:hypothetical protein
MVENPVRKAADVSGQRLDEEGVPADLLMVRSVLQTMPKVSCPVGFEFRLQKRIDALSAEPSRAGGRSWVLGWAGAGLGFATALIIAVVAFDFGFNGIATVGSQGVIANSQNTVSQPNVATNPQSVPTTVSQTQDVAPQLAQQKTTAADKDTNLTKTPGDGQNYPAHLVGGNNP